MNDRKQERGQEALCASLLPPIAVIANCLSQSLSHGPGRAATSGLFKLSSPINLNLVISSIASTLSHSKQNENLLSDCDMRVSKIFLIN